MEKDMQTKRPKHYDAQCRRCGTFVRLGLDEMDFSKKIAVKCPVCGATVFFSDSQGLLHEGVKPSYGTWEKE